MFTTIPTFYGTFAPFYESEKNNLVSKLFIKRFEKCTKILNKFRIQISQKKCLKSLKKRKLKLIWMTGKLVKQTIDNKIAP